VARTSAYQLQIGTDSDDANARILLADGALVAVLVELSDEGHGEDRGKWTIEATFGLRHERVPDIFPSLESAADWVSEHICEQRFNLGADVVRLA